MKLTLVDMKVNDGNVKLTDIDVKVNETNVDLNGVDVKLTDVNVNLNDGEGDVTIIDMDHSGIDVDVHIGVVIRTPAYVLGPGGFAHAVEMVGLPAVQGRLHV